MTRKIPLTGQYAVNDRTMRKSLNVTVCNGEVTPEYFYSGGGEAIPVTDLTTALAALNLIAEQGEGLGGGIYDAEGEISHYYRFEQLRLGRYYQKGDEPGQPSGPPLDLDYSAVYPIAMARDPWSRVALSGGFADMLNFGPAGNLTPMGSGSFFLVTLPQ